MRVFQKSLTEVDDPSQRWMIHPKDEQDCSTCWGRESKWHTQISLVFLSRMQCDSVLLPPQPPHHEAQYSQTRSKPSSPQRLSPGLLPQPWESDTHATADYLWNTFEDFFDDFNTFPFYDIPWSTFQKWNVPSRQLVCWEVRGGYHLIQTSRQECISTSLLSHREQVAGLLMGQKNATPVRQMASCRTSESISPQADRSPKGGQQSALLHVRSLCFRQVLRMLVPWLHSQDRQLFTECEFFPCGDC